jgi:hypothetical protein
VRNKIIRIAVVGHHQNYGKLPSNFEYIKRISDTSLLPSINTTHKFHSPSYVWSEYAAWWENSDIAMNATTTGLYHYRCVLNLDPISFDALPRHFLRGQLARQKKHLNRDTHFLIVGNPNIVEGNVWEHFCLSHPESEKLISIACEFYDAITEKKKGTSLLRLKSTNCYYPRNIFVTNSSFGKQWLQISFKIAEMLDQTSEPKPTNRWGGFILERLFTLYVDDYSNENILAVETVKQSYYIPFMTWIRGLLVRYRLINFIRHHLKKVI